MGCKAVFVPGFMFRSSFLQDTLPNSTILMTYILEMTKFWLQLQCEKKMLDSSNSTNAVEGSVTTTATCVWRTWRPSLSLQVPSPAPLVWMNLITESFSTQRSDQGRMTLQWPQSSCYLQQQAAQWVDAGSRRLFLSSAFLRPTHVGVVLYSRWASTRPHSRVSGVRFVFSRYERCFSPRLTGLNH